MTIHMAAAVLLYFWIIEPNTRKLVGCAAHRCSRPSLAAGAAVLIGVGIDVVNDQQPSIQGTAQKASRS